MEVQEQKQNINKPLTEIETTAPGKLRVIKRNGKVVAFEDDKIKVAITKAFLAIESGNAAFYQEGDRVRTRTNKSGGIQGGISNGEDIYFNVAFKPVATIMQDQESIDQEGKSTKILGKGRHDPCVVPRAVPIVEAMSALVIADFYLISRTNKLTH